MINGYTNRNKLLRKKLRESGVYLWELAKALNISDATMTRRMREEFSSDELNKLFSVIDEISANKEH